MSQPTFLYFRFAGRAFAPRVALFNAFGKEGWKDERLGMAGFKKLKQAYAADPKSARLISQNLPQLELSSGIIMFVV